MISFVCGQLCCGKTKYAQALAFATNGVYVEVGDIVRELKGSQDRDVLQDSKHLLTDIIARLSIKVKFYGDKDVIVSGVRQQEILQAFPNSTLLWIECPTPLRKERYLNRSREGDDQTFETAERGDIQLGIFGVKQYIFQQNEIKL